MFPGNRVVHLAPTPRCADRSIASETRVDGTSPSATLRIRRSSAVIVLAGLVAMSLASGCASLPPAAPPPTAPAAATAGATTIVAVAPPAPPAMTLPKFLGLDVAFAGLRGIGMRVRNRLGTRFPGLEPKPPVLSIADPANMNENASPAVKAAAEAKAEADQAPQKAKAIRYLASLGCGKCYPDTEKALLAAMEDCNEQIRYEAVAGLRKSIGDQCGCCRQDSCCTPKLVQKLYDLAYGVDESGCHVEPSSRIRRNARLAICACGSVSVDGDDALPAEGPQVLVQSDPKPSESAAAQKADAAPPAEPPATTGASASLDVRRGEQRTATIVLDASESVAAGQSDTPDQTAGLTLPETLMPRDEPEDSGGVRRE